MWRVLWTARVLDWQKPFPHSWHLKGFSLEWMYLQREATAGVSGAAGTAGGTDNAAPSPKPLSPLFYFLKFFAFFYGEPHRLTALPATRSRSAGHGRGSSAGGSAAPAPVLCPAAKPGGSPPRPPTPSRTPLRKGVSEQPPRRLHPSHPPRSRAQDPAGLSFWVIWVYLIFFWGGSPLLSLSARLSEAHPPPLLLPLTGGPAGGPASGKPCGRCRRCRAARPCGSARG